jgi:hypothetical protein
MTDMIISYVILIPVNVYLTIIHTYGNIKGFKTICNYEGSNKIFGAYENEDCLTNGVNTVEIKLFCIKYRLPLYALNDDERVFETYHPESRNKNAPIMMFRIINNHLQPIPKNKQKSI